MAVSNRDRVGKAFEQLAEGLRPYVDRRLRRFHPQKDDWFERWVASSPQGISPDSHLDDPQVQLRAMADFWQMAFRQELPNGIRNVVFSLRNRRNEWAHNKAFQFDDTYRVLDEVEQLLTAIDAPQSDAVGAEKAEFMRAKVETELRKAGDKGAAATTAVKGLRPWREVVQPHDDVAQGRYALAEFAADLRAVHRGSGSAEYVKPVEFFRRTYLTAGLSQLLVDSAQRVTGLGGAPVVDLQTSFGGGKTHSMIALYHLFSGVDLAELPDELRSVLADVGVGEVPQVPRAVLVGTSNMRPGQPQVKDDGTEVRTMWGELAWQLGGRAAFDLVAQSDATGTAPGDALDDVFAMVGPCLILIDEWVAYARQLFADENLPAGSFDTHFTFAQGLTEAVKRSPGVLLVVSIPASSSPDSDDSEALGSETELGGYGGKEALARLRKVIGRLESSWRPATAEESFEIVRRRLFKSIEPDLLADRDAVAQAFADYYRKQAAELPEEVRSPAYMDRMRQAYPIHPELFDRLYQDWSTLDRFQRTRGVLRLMASVISALWEAGDQSPLIMPASLPLELTNVNQELLRNLEDSFKPVLDADVDGEGSTSRELDREFPNLGKYQAARRVARAVFFGAAPTLGSANRGVDAQRVRLACALPGETIETYGDALKRMSDRASYLYVEGTRYWFDVRQSVVRQAQEQAEQFRTQRLDEVHAELIQRLKAAVSDRGAFSGVHVAPGTSEEVSDDEAIRLVVLNPGQPFIERSDTCAARDAAGEILARRGGSARQRRNMIVFLAPDHRAIEHLEQAAAEYLAWSRIVEDAVALNLDKAQERQATERCNRANDAITVRLAETYRWLLVPRQNPTPGAPVELSELKVDGGSGLAARAADRLQREGILYTQYPPALLRHLLDGPLATEWTDGSVTLSRLWEVLCQYPYLPKLRDRSVLETTVASGPASVTWQSDGFATADLLDGSRFGGLVAGAQAVSAGPTTLIVRPDVALAQMEADAPGDDEDDDGDDDELGKKKPKRDEDDESTPLLTRFQGAVELDGVRMVKQFQQVAEEVLSHLQAEGTLKVTLEIEATSDNGYADDLVRTVTENAVTLKFKPGAGFEEA